MFQCTESEVILFSFLNCKLLNEILLTKPNGPILGANEEVAPTSPPTHLK